MATASNSGSGQKQSTSSSSRFASLKVFKFAAVSSKNSPPIPPPKEKPPTNVSLVSLTTEPSTPRTPVTPDYTRSQSTPPCPTHSPALSSQDHASSSSSSSTTSFGKGLLKFAKRSLTPKSLSRQLSETPEDSSISLPWNFQHNMHVDEGYNGLPPTWVASLANLGYSEEEIEAISYRRTTSRAASTIPFQHPNFPNLPSSSQLSIITTTTQNRLTPSPSIRRQPSQASIQSKGTRRTRKMSTETAKSRQSFYQSSTGNDSAGDLTYVTDDFPPPLPTKPPIPLNGHAHKPKKSVDTLASGLTSNGRMPSPITRSKSPLDIPPTPPQVQTQSQLRSRPSQSRNPSKDSVSKVGKTTGPTGTPVSRPPRTPPRSASQMFRVVNNDALSQSPPPAYHLDDASPINIVEKPSLTSSVFQPPLRQTPQPQLRKAPSTRQQQVDNEPRSSVVSTATVTPRSDSADQPTDQPDTSEITSADRPGGEEAGEDEEPASLPPLELSMSSLSMSPAVPAKKKKRYSLAPPRLSLGQDAFADIGSWGDGLFDTLSTGTTATTSVNSGLDSSTGSGLVKKSTPVFSAKDRRKLETNLSVSSAGSNFSSASLATKEKERDEKKKLGTLTSPSPLVSPPLATTRSLPTQATHKSSQSSFSQSQPQLRSTPPSKTAPTIPIPQPPTLSSSTSSSSSTSTSSSNPPQIPPPTTTTTDGVDLFLFPKPPPEPARGRAGPLPPIPPNPPLPRTESSTSISNSQPQFPRERSSSRASAVHRSLPPQKPLPTLSLMSPIPLPNPPSHVELKGKISTVSLKTAAKRDREREKEREKAGEKAGSAEKKDVAKKDEKAIAVEEDQERWPVTAKETVELMASINHDNGGLDFGEQRKNQDSSVSDLDNKTCSVSLDPPHPFHVRDSHLSVDSTRFDPNRLSNTSAGSRGSSRSSRGTGLKLVIRGGDHNENRDSNVSTSTITHATIVSGPVEVLTRVRADLVATPRTPVPGSGLNFAGSPSPAALDAPSPVELLTEAGSRGTTPKQTLPPASKVDVIDEERLRRGFGGRSPSPDSSTNSHSSSSATTSSSTGPSSFRSAKKVPGFTGPAIKHHPGWEAEEGTRRVSVTSSPLASPYKSEFGGSDEEEEDDDEVEVGDEEEEAVITVISPSRKGSAAGLMDEIQRRPSLVIPPISSYSLMACEPHSNAESVSRLLSPLNGAPHSAGSGGSSPGQRYPGWVSNVLSKIGLETFVDEKVDPRDYFEGLTEVAEGESGFVYQAKVVRTVPGSKLTKRGPQPGGVVAIKAVPILPSGSSKLEDLRREVEAMKRVFEDDRSAATPSPFSSSSGYRAGMGHVLIMDALYVDLQEDSLWIRMELMERSLADVVALVEDGHMEKMDEKVVARFASDMVQALSYLHSLGIAHRDVRSDNLLLNRDGVLKIADFSNAVTVTPESQTCTGLVGVIFWQAPEMRAGAYNPTKADVWSLGATIWEMAESTPPFHNVTSAAELRDRWPPLTRAKEFSRSLHDFLTLCSNPIPSRPESNALLQTPFVRSAARRSAIIQILKRCQTIENLLAGSRPSIDSQGTFSRR